jgi:subtilisin family serine protease
MRVPLPQRTPGSRCSLLPVLCAALLTVAWSPVQTDRMRPPRSPRIDERLEGKSLAGVPERADTAAVPVWIYFTDKGIADDLSLKRAVDRFARGLDPHTRRRRLKVRTEQTLTGFADLPLHEPYVTAVLETGVRLRARSRWLNAVSVGATDEQIRRMAGLGFISAIDRVAGFRRRGFETWESGTIEPLLRKTAPYDYGPSYTHLNQINIPQLHQSLQQSDFGAPGEGIRICLLDTGFQLYHEAFAHLDVLAQWDFINDDDEVGEEEEDPEGQSSHGTSVLSIIGGYAPGELIGPAYGASYLLGKTEVHSSETPIEEDYWVAGLEWAEELGADVVSSSLGYLDWYDYSDMDGNTAVTTVAADLAASRGVTVVTAAGNEGQTGWTYIIAPSDGHQVIAVGAVDTLGVRPRWSSQGPTYDGRIKPDVMACGSGTYAARPYTSDMYWRTTGTSVATPLVGGAAALLLQADPDMTPARIIDALRRTANRATNPDNYYGWGIIDAYAARWGVSTPELSVSSVQNYPNPFTESTVIFFPISEPTQATISIFTVSGELVRELDVSCEMEGRCEALWDGRNQGGEQTAAGIYICQVVTEDRVMRGKLVRLKE